MEFTKSVLINETRINSKDKCEISNTKYKNMITRDIPTEIPNGISKDIETDTPTDLKRWYFKIYTFNNENMEYSRYNFFQTCFSYVMIIIGFGCFGMMLLKDHKKDECFNDTCLKYPSFVYDKDNIQIKKVIHILK